MLKKHISHFYLKQLKATLATRMTHEHKKAYLVQHHLGVGLQSTMSEKR